MQSFSDKRTNEVELSAIRSWFAEPLGNQVILAEEAILGQLLSGLFGYHLVQIGITRRSLFSSSPINHKVTMSISRSEGCASLDKMPAPSDDTNGSPPAMVDFQANPAELPFLNDTIDVVLLHHLLEFSDAPQDLLREAARVTIPSGYLVLIGFNPVSLWGLWKGLAQWKQGPPWNGSYIRPGRVMDWLNLLEFKIDRAHYAINGLPLAFKARYSNPPDYSQGVSRRASWPFGAVYVIVACKQRGGMTPIRPLWTNRLPKLAVIRPARRETILKTNPDDHQKYR